MSSNKQKANAIKLKRAEARSEQELQAKEDFKKKLLNSTQNFNTQREAAKLLINKKHWVNEDNLRPTNSHGKPEFVYRGYYVDVHFKCKFCGASQNWSATQQKWWYETAKGDVWTTAILCKPCRRTEQQRIIKARELQLQGKPKETRTDK